MEALVSTAARAAVPLPFARAHRRRPPVSVAVRAPARGWRCRSAAPDPVPSEEPASASATTVVVADKPAEEPSEVGAVSDGSDGTAVEATVVDSLVASSVEAAEEGGGVDDLLSKLDIEVTPTYVLFGSGALLALLILSKVVSAIDSVPLLPKLLELVGTGYSIWFTTKYLLFKESRDALFAKVEDLKERII